MVFRAGPSIGSHFRWPGASAAAYGSYVHRGASSATDPRARQGGSIARPMATPARSGPTARRSPDRVQRIPVCGLLWLRGTGLRRFRPGVLREPTFDFRSRLAGSTVYAGKSLCVRAASGPRSESRLRRAARRWTGRRACRRTSRTSQPRKPHRPGEDGGRATRGTIFAASTHPRASSLARLAVAGACAPRDTSRFPRTAARADLVRCERVQKPIEAGRTLPGVPSLAVSRAPRSSPGPGPGSPENASRGASPTRSGLRVLVGEIVPATPARHVRRQSSQPSQGRVLNPWPAFHCLCERTSRLAGTCRPPHVDRHQKPDAPRSCGLYACRTDIGTSTDRTRAAEGPALRSPGVACQKALRWPSNNHRETPLIRHSGRGCSYYRAWLPDLESRTSYGQKAWRESA